MKVLKQELLVASGFHEDCDELVRRCLQSETVNYQVFCNIWKDMSFANVFLGRSSGADLAEFSEEAIAIAKTYMFANTNNFEIKVTGLFLVYALINLQPYASFGKLRLTPADVPRVHATADTARRAQRLDVVYILGAIMTSPGVEYHIAEKDYGLERMLRRRFNETAPAGVLSRSVLHRQNDEQQLLRELTALEQRYHRAKTEIHGSGRLDRTLSYAEQSLSADLARTLDNVICRKNDDDDDGEASHERRVESIKSRAMKEAVSQMKHLVSVEDRQPKATTPQTSPSKREINSRCGKVKTGSPIKPLPTSRKRAKAASKLAAKRSKTSPAADQAEEFTIDQLLDSRAGTSSTDVMPILIRKDDGNYIEIEMVDEDQPPGQITDDVELIIPDRIDTESDTEEEEEESENVHLKGKDFKDAKKPHLRAKLRKFGILGVAGLKEPDGK